MLIGKETLIAVGEKFLGNRSPMRLGYSQARDRSPTYDYSRRFDYPPRDGNRSAERQARSPSWGDRRREHSPLRRDHSPYQRDYSPRRFDRRDRSPSRDKFHRRNLDSAPVTSTSAGPAQPIVIQVEQKPALYAPALAPVVYPQQALSQAPSASVAAAPKKYICFSCGGEGHLLRDCPTKKAREAQALGLAPPQPPPPSQQ